jgi:hypothetical protein
LGQASVVQRCLLPPLPTSTLSALTSLLPSRHAAASLPRPHCSRSLHVWGLSADRASASAHEHAVPTIQRRLRRRCLPAPPLLAAAALLAGVSHAPLGHIAALPPRPLLAARRLCTCIPLVCIILARFWFPPAGWARSWGGAPLARCTWAWTPAPGSTWPSSSSAWNASPPTRCRRAAGPAAALVVCWVVVAG